MSFDGQKKVFHNLGQDELQSKLASDFSFSVVGFKDHISWIQIFGINWFKVGGPQIYHDSATLEIFVQEKESDCLIQMLEKTLVEFGAVVEFIEGASAPSPEPIWRRLKSFFKSKSVI